MRPLIAITPLFAVVAFASMPGQLHAQACYTCSTGSPPNGQCTTATGAGRQFCIWNGETCWLDGEPCVLDTFTDSLPASSSLLAQTKVSGISLRRSVDGRMYLRLASGKGVPVSRDPEDNLIIRTCGGETVSVERFLNSMRQSQ